MRYLVLLFCVSIYGCTHTSGAKSEHQKYEAKGRLVDVKGKKQHLFCTGSGSPTVIMEAGLTENSLSYSLLQPLLSKKFRTCSYDRPGLGWSQKKDGVLSSEDIAENLHQLLKDSGELTPLVLVGHSAGGIYARKYAHMYPAGVLGLVFIDSAHEQGEVRGIVKSKEEQAALEEDLSLLEYCEKNHAHHPDVQRALDEDRKKLIANGSSFEIEFFDMQNQPSSCGPIKNEIIRHTNEGQISGPPMPLGKLPILVFTSDPKVSLALGFPKEFLPKLKILSDEIINLSSSSRHYEVEGAGHQIQRDKPQFLYEKIYSWIQGIVKEPK